MMGDVLVSWVEHSPYVAAQFELASEPGCTDCGGESTIRRLMDWRRGRGREREPCDELSKVADLLTNSLGYVC